jgi:UDP-N-acetylmuramoyl-tripeptide--D-alanyl-D-alanine ligase
MLPLMILTVAEVAAAVGGEIRGGGGAGSVEITGVSQDSREIEPGMLFVPIVAERDGHEFIAAAVVAGASAYLTSGRMLDVPTGVEAYDPVTALRGSAPPVAIVVDDTAAALSALGSAARDRIGSGVPVVAITGSVGKTTTKDFVAAILGEQRRVHSNRRSFNNELGVPLTLLGAPEGVEAVVIEMGSRGLGHIAALCDVARPTVGVVTTVGLAHTSELGSLDGVVRAKGELIAFLGADGLAVLNAAVPEVAAMAELTNARVVTFGQGGDLEAADVVLDDELRPRFRLVGGAVDAEVELGARGWHQVDNAVAAALVAIELGCSVDAVVSGLAAPVLSPLRMELVRTSSGARVLNDSYNANPLSTAAALRSLTHIPARRRTAVLGVMAELGAAAPTEHAAIAELAAGLGVRLIAFDAPDYGAEPATDLDEVLALLGELDEGDAVLVKGSRVAGLERLVERLVER